MLRLLRLGLLIELFSERLGFFVSTFFLEALFVYDCFDKVKFTLELARFSLFCVFLKLTELIGVAICSSLMSIEELINIAVFS